MGGRLIDHTFMAIFMTKVCTKGFDDCVIKGEHERMAQAFTMGAAGESPPLPLTALVIQVPVRWP